VWILFTIIFLKNHTGQSTYRGWWWRNQLPTRCALVDKATFAYLADVFILEKYRGKGLSKWLIEVIQFHPELQGLRRWMLGTRDAHGLYAQFGWSEISEETRKIFMQRHFPDVYAVS